MTRNKDRREWRSPWWVQRGLAWPTRMSIQGTILAPTIKPNQESSHKERIPQDMCINEDLSYKERPSSPRNECQLYATIKTPKPSQIKVCTIYRSSGTLELWKFSNLTFRGYLAGSIPVLFVRSSSFLLRRFLPRTCEDRVTYWRFLASSIGVICGDENSNNCITTS